MIKHLFRVVSESRELCHALRSNGKQFELQLKRQSGGIEKGTWEEQSRSGWSYSREQECTEWMKRIAFSFAANRSQSLTILLTTTCTSAKRIKRVILAKQLQKLNTERRCYSCDTPYSAIPSKRQLELRYSLLLPPFGSAIGRILRGYTAISCDIWK